MIPYKINDIIKCKVIGVRKYGIFIHTEEGYNGLIHISEISSGYVRNIYDYIDMGEIIQAKIIDISTKEEKAQLKINIKDMDYRETKKLNRIVETKTGFSNLEKNLNKWIENKYSQIVEKIE